ncbi:C2H2 zinc finger [Ceratobasidium sp. AG-Ba]|nr:C2H2 zinc finger [Ceratobasidium sp. AG-Ba]
MLPGTEQAMYTCLSCSIAFFSAEDQRVHYKSDHHRYNMKRRVANLPPVSAQAFDQKVLERRAETAIMAAPKGATCQTCNKTFATEGSYQSHIASRKHKENELKAASKPAQPEPTAEVAPESNEPASEPAEPQPAEPKDEPRISLSIPDDATEDEINTTIDAKIAAARSKLSPNSCLFCPHTADSISNNLEHMSSAHSFYIPDAEYLVDLPGLIGYLGEKIAVGNVCIACPSREFRTMDAVRKHMIDKGHCRIGYDNETQRLEVSEYYDFSSSYPDAEARKQRREERAARRAERAAQKEATRQDAEWEDVEGGEEGESGEEADEIVDETASDSDADSESTLEDNALSYGDTPYELVLPSGARIGHRSMRRYYAQAPSRAVLAPRPGTADDENSGAALVRRLIADKNSALVPTKGGFGAFGSGTEVVKARNRGEAREAGRHIREFRDQNKREQFKTKVGFVHNNQKHFRDPLLQVCPMLAVPTITY